VALEHILDEIGIERTEVSTLHQRIEALLKVQPEMAEDLMGIKWLGNAGSHQSSVSLEDLLDGYQVMEHALDTLFGQRVKAKRAATVAKDLTRKHASKRQGKK
jgi:hypothetical protein